MGRIYRYGWVQRTKRRWRTTWWRH